MINLEKKAIKERAEFNKEVYEKIFSLTKKPKKILDLGCGLNPLNFPYKDIEYLATDIDKGILKKVKKYFKKNKIKGNVFYLDLNNIENLKKVKKVEMVFLFKVLDIFNRKKKIIAEILKSLKTKWIIISFATKTISGKKMRNPKRKWFENILRKLAYKYTTLRFYNEIFYIVKK